VHLGGAGEVRCSELACGAGRQRSREAEREMSEPESPQGERGATRA